MLWDHYVFRRGNAVHDLWDDLMKDRPVDLLYIAGRGFDIRAQTVMREFITGQQGSGRKTANAKLLMLGFEGYELDDSIVKLTEENAAALEALFSPLGSAETITLAVPDVKPCDKREAARTGASSGAPSNGMREKPAKGECMGKR